MQYWDGHTSTYSIKTLVIYLYCAYCARASYCVCYLFIVACYLSLPFIYFVHCSILIYSLFDFCFIVCCSKEKDSILILDCIPGISIMLYLLINNCTIVQEHHHHLCKSINIIHQTALILS